MLGQIHAKLPKLSRRILLASLAPLNNHYSLFNQIIFILDQIDMRNHFYNLLHVCVIYMKIIVAMLRVIII